MNKEFLMEMLHSASPSGNEYDLQRKVMAYAKTFVDEIKTDTTGNVYASYLPDHTFQVMLCGHIDEIALMVVNFTANGCLKVIKTGGVRIPTYFGQKVRVLTKQGVVYGSVGVSKSLLENKDVKAEDLWIDIGATSKEEAMSIVSHGDPVILDTDVRPLLNNCITARAMDDRIGAFIVLEAARKAKEQQAKVGVTAITTVGEETNMRGAYWAAANQKPSCAIVVDVTFASDAIGADDVYGEININGGPVLCHAPIVNRKLNQALEKAAEKRQIKIQWEGASGYTGTDGDRVHVVGEGIPVALVSIPLRYMHSPSEVGSLKDIQDCIDLIAQFLMDLDENFSMNPYVD
ncbi:MAG: M20/M25/M40 family metallo-hydrolase [Erysipelotrichaceae bacterium]|nr:M20/M25/M40 family metallo-hydrolase [Erysipelotrichaceae bacterium]